MAGLRRREFIAHTTLGFASLVAGLAVPRASWAGPVRQGSASSEGWAQAERIVRGLVAPAFPARTLRVTDQGARPDGATDSRPAIQRAIDRCNAEGGGHVIVDRGRWLSNGPIVLKSRVDLHLEEGAVLRFSPDPDAYLPVVLTRWEGTELYNYSPLVYAYQASHVAITGLGTLDGQAKDGFGTWKPNQTPAQLRLRQMGHDGISVHERVFGKGHWLRPPMVQFFGCRHVLVEGVTITDAPFWVLHPVYSSDVIVRGVHVNAGNLNNDGVDPDSCNNVLIEDCRFDTLDDSIAIKSGRDADGWRVGRPCEHVVIRRCVLNSQVAGGISIGSEMSGGVRHVYIERCTAGAVEEVLYAKANLDRGGAVENVWVRDIVAREAKRVIHFTTDYHGYRGTNHPPTFRDFVIERVTCERAETAIVAKGTEASPITNIRISDVEVRAAAAATEFRHVRGVALDNVRVNGAIVAR